MQASYDNRHGCIVLDENVKKLKYDYLRRKIVSAKFNEKHREIDMDGISVIKSTDYAASLHVDTEVVPIGQVISVLSEGGNLADITITDPQWRKLY